MWDVELTRPGLVAMGPEDAAYKIFSSSVSVSRLEVPDFMKDCAKSRTFWGLLFDVLSWWSAISSNRRGKAECLA